MRNRFPSGMLALLVALAPLAMAPTKCGVLPGRISIEPGDGAQVESFAVPIFIRFFNVDDASIRVLIDGADRTAEFTRRVRYANTDLRLTVTVPLGAHEIEASAVSGGDPVDVFAEVRRRKDSF